MNLQEKVFASFQNLWVRGLVVGGLTVGVDVFTHYLYGERNYHLSGAVTATMARAIDMASTIPAIRQVNRPEFWNLKLNEEFSEGSPFHKPHPTFREYFTRSVPLSLLAIGLAAYAPPIGYVYLAMTPLIYANNNSTTKKIEEIIIANARKDNPPRTMERYKP